MPCITLKSGIRLNLKRGAMQNKDFVKALRSGDIEAQLKPFLGHARSQEKKKQLKR